MFLLGWSAQAHRQTARGRGGGDAACHSRILLIFSGVFVKELPASEGWLLGLFSHPCPQVGNPPLLPNMPLISTSVSSGGYDESSLMMEVEKGGGTFLTCIAGDACDFSSLLSEPVRKLDNLPPPPQVRAQTDPSLPRGDLQLDQHSLGHILDNQDRDYIRYLHTHTIPGFIFAEKCALPFNSFLTTASETIFFFHLPSAASWCNH